MGRSVVTKVLPPTYVNALSGTTLTPTAADPVNNNQFVLDGNEILIALNTDTGGAHNVTITSAPDQHGRVQHITSDPVPACVGTTPGMKLYPRFPQQGWVQGDGNLYLTADNAAIKFLVVQLQ